MPESGSTYFNVPFATDGDLSPVPNPVQGSGSISYTQGYGPDYSEDPAVDPSTALNVARATFNQLMLDITTAIAQLQQGSFPPWVSTAANGGTPLAYAAYQIVMYTDGIAYQSQVASNTSTPGADSNWVAIPLNINSFTTGDIKPSFKNTADSGWILMNDGTIGDATSGATYANALALNLYTLLWTNVANTWAPVTGGRGVSAAADWAAHKKLGLPLALGRALACAGAGAGLTSRALGQTLGDENLAQHTHTVNDPQHLHAGLAQSNGDIGYSGGNGAGFTGVATIGITSGSDNFNTLNASTGITLNNTGTGTAGNMQPSLFVTFMVKL
jgi:hypothetical protein